MDSNRFFDQLTGKYWKTLEDAKRHYTKKGYSVLFENENEITFGKYGTHTDFPDLDGESPSGVFTVGEYLYPYG